MSAPIACSNCYGTGYGVDGKPCPCGCRAAPLPAAPAPTAPRTHPASDYDQDYVCQPVAALPAEQAPTELPPLPQPMQITVERPHGLYQMPYYTDKQMQGYALAALAARQAPNTVPRLDYDLLKLTLEQTQERLRQADEAIAQRDATALRVAQCAGEFARDAARQAPTDVEDSWRLKVKSATPPLPQDFGVRDVDAAKQYAIAYADHLARYAARQVVAPDARELLRSILQTDIGIETIHKLEDGQGTNTDDGKAWLAAKQFIAQENAS